MFVQRLIFVKGFTSTMPGRTGTLGHLLTTTLMVPHCRHTDCLADYPPWTRASDTRNFISSHVATSRHLSASVHDHVEHASSSSPQGTSEKHPTTRKGSQPFGKARGDVRPLEATARSDPRSSRHFERHFTRPGTRLRRGSRVT
jgi:hypothetical protein